MSSVILILAFLCLGIFCFRIMGKIDTFTASGNMRPYWDEEDEKKDKKEVKKEVKSEKQVTSIKNNCITKKSCSF